MNYPLMPTNVIFSFVIKRRYSMEKLAGDLLWDQSLNSPNITHMISLSQVGRIKVKIFLLMTAISSHATEMRPKLRNHCLIYFHELQPHAKQTGNCLCFLHLIRVAVTNKQKRKTFTYLLFSFLESIFQFHH